MLSYINPSKILSKIVKSHGLVVSHSIIVLLAFKMNEILKIYEERYCLIYHRIKELTQTFMRLLENIEKSKLFLSSVSHAQYRIEYIGHIIATTLANHQEKTIQKLMKKINELSGNTDKSNSYVEGNSEIEHLGKCGKNS
jgi:hypothetical protein